MPEGPIFKKLATDGGKNNITIPIPESVCIGDSLATINRSFQTLAEQADLTNATLAITSTNAQSQIDFLRLDHTTRINQLSAALSGDIISAPWTTTTKFLSTRYNTVVPANKGGAGTNAGILSANGKGLVVGLENTPSDYTPNQANGNAIVTVSYITDKLNEEYPPFTLFRAFTAATNTNFNNERTTSTNEYNALATSKIQLPASAANGQILTFDNTSGKTSLAPGDYWVAKNPAAPSLVGAISCDANFNTAYVQVVPEVKGGAGTINGILSALGNGKVVRALPSLDYVIPNDLGIYATNLSLESYLTKLSAARIYTTKDEHDNTKESWVQNPLINPVTGRYYTSTEINNALYAESGHHPGQSSSPFPPSSQINNNVLTLVNWTSGTGKLMSYDSYIQNSFQLAPTFTGLSGWAWTSRSPSAPTLTGAITSTGGNSLSGFITNYAQVVPANKGGAGTINGLLKANGSGVVSQAIAGPDYLTVGTAGLYSNYVPISSLRVDTNFRNNSLIKYDDYQQTWRIASPEDEPFAEVNFITGLASQQAGWYSGCAFSERRVIAWGQLDGKGPNDHYKFSQTNSTNTVTSPHNYSFIPFHTEYETNGNVGNNIHYFDLETNKKAYIKEVIWNWSCGMAWVRNESKGGRATGLNNDPADFVQGPTGSEDTIWVIGKHYSESTNESAKGRTINPNGSRDGISTYMDNFTGSIGISGNGGGVNKQTCGFVGVRLPGFPRVKRHPITNNYIKEEIIKIQCKCDPGMPIVDRTAAILKDNQLDPADPLKFRSAFYTVSAKGIQFENYILWGALTNFGNLYVWGRSRDGCFGLGDKTAGVDLQLNTPRLLNTVVVDNDVNLVSGGTEATVISRTFAGSIADFEYTSAEFNATCLGVITVSAYDEDFPNIFPTTRTDIPNQALYFAGDNENFQQGAGLRDTRGSQPYWPASNDYFLRAQKMEEGPGTNQFGLCNPSQIAANAALQPKYITNAKKIVRSLYGGRIANGYIDTDGRLWMCGSNKYGLLGNCGYAIRTTSYEGGIEHYSYGSGFAYKTVKLSSVTRSYQTSKYTGETITNETFDAIPQFVQEYPFRSSAYPTGTITQKLATSVGAVNVQTGQLDVQLAASYNSINGTYGQFRGRGFFCEAKVCAWQDTAGVGTAANQLGFDKREAVSVYNQRALSAIGELLELPTAEKINAKSGSTYTDTKGSYTVTLNGYSERPRFVDAYLAGLNAPYLIAMAERSTDNKLTDRQYNMYACGMNGIIAINQKQTTGKTNAVKVNHGYLGINSEAIVVPRLLPCVYKREVRSDDGDTDDLGEIKLDYVRDAVKLICSDTNGQRNIVDSADTYVNYTTTQASVRHGSDSGWTEYYDIQWKNTTVKHYANATYSNLGANAYIDNRKLAYISGFNTYNDPPDYDSLSYQYFTRLPINNVEDMILGGNLEAHMYQFFRTSPGIVWGMGEGQSNVLGTQNKCYLPTRII